MVNVVLYLTMLRLLVVSEAPGDVEGMLNTPRLNTHEDKVVDPAAVKVSTTAAHVGSSLHAVRQLTIVTGLGLGLMVKVSPIAAALLSLNQENTPDPASLGFPAASSERFRFSKPRPLPASTL